MGTFWKLLAVFMSVWLGVGSALLAKEPLTTTERRALSPPAASRQIRADLSSILLEKPEPISGNRFVIGDTWMHTNAYATPYKGLCTRNTVSLYYAPIAKPAPGEKIQDMPVKPYRIESETSYRFVSPPTGKTLEAAEDEERPRSPFASECSKADRIEKDNEWHGWFSAEDAQSAYKGGLAMAALKSWIRVDGHEFATCSKEEPSYCKSDRLDYLGLDELGGVSSCPAEPGLQCLEMGKYGDIFKIKAKMSGPYVKVEDVVSVDYEIAIIVT